VYPKYSRGRDTIWIEDFLDLTTSMIFIFPALSFNAPGLAGLECIFPEQGAGKNQEGPEKDIRAGIMGHGGFPDRWSVLFN
jgi:hypothetical protein